MLQEQYIAPLPPVGEFTVVKGKEFAFKPLPHGSRCYDKDNHCWARSAPEGLLADSFAWDCWYAVPSTSLEKVSSSVEAVQVGGDHYKGLKIQPADFIHANGLGFLEGCVIKRMCRHGSKNKVEDLRKAMHEIQLLAKYEYNIDNLLP